VSVGKGIEAKWHKTSFVCIEVHKELSTLSDIFCFNFYFIPLYSYFNSLCTEYLSISLYHWSCRGLNAQQAWLSRLSYPAQGLYQWVYWYRVFMWHHSV